MPEWLLSHFKQKPWIGCHFVTHYFQPKGTGCEEPYNYNTIRLHHQGTSALVKLFKSHLKELLGASAPTPPTNSLKNTRVIGF